MASYTDLAEKATITADLQSNLCINSKVNTNETYWGFIPSYDIEEIKEIIQENQKLKQALDCFKNAKDIKDNITDVRFVNNKVTFMHFADGTSVKSVCDKEDTFSKEVGVMVCYLKKLLGTKHYNNLIGQCLAFEENRIKQAESEAAEKAKFAKKKAKNLARKARRAAEKRAEQIEIQAEAYKKAIRELEAEKEGK